jgi:2-hydroxyacyl-CoA lyase 1
MATTSGGRILIEALKRQDVSTIFDLPGDPVGSILAAGREAGIRTYSFRHEQASAMAAQAYSYVTRSMGVSIVASGPAMTNAVTGLTTAWANCWPMLLVGGASELRRKGLGDFQETPQVEAAAPFCKWSVAIDNPRRIPYFVETAFKTALGGRPGPVYLDFPADMINARLEEDDVEWGVPAPEPARPQADPEDVKRAAAAIAASERPLLLIGKGAAWAGAEDEARELVERLQIPFVPSPMGKGVIPDDHPLCVAGARSHALEKADLVLLVGARFNWIFHFGRAPRFAEGVKVIQVDIDPSEIGTSVPATVGLVGDAKAVLRQLSEEVGMSARRRMESDWVRDLQRQLEENAAAIAPTVDSEEPFTNMYRLFRDVNAVADDGAIFVDDGESTMAVSRVMQTLRKPRHRIDAGVSGCMGTGIPYAIGAQIAAPGTQVISMNGDYAFGWNGIEIETACRYRLPILFVVANNGSVRSTPNVFNMADYTGEDALRYDRMMDAFGGHSEFVQTSDQLRPALERALASGKTALVNVVIDPNPRRKPQKFGWLDRLGRMRYEGGRD